MAASKVYSNIKRMKKEKRRSRVRSMRNAFIGFLFLWIIFSIVMLGVLAAKVFSLQKQVDKLSQSNNSVDISSQTTDSKTQNDISITKNGLNDDSNLAGMSDTLKVYLTFDDGPSNNTESILKILDDYGIKATFFIQGKNGKSSKELMKEISDEGHTIGIHSYTHSYSDIYSSLESFVSDVSDMKDMIEEATGEDVKFYRFPGGSSNNIAGDKIYDYIQYLKDNNITYVDWNVASNDAATPVPAPETIVENVMKDVVKYKTSVVLLHDSDDKNNTVKALPILIDELREAGAVILPISDEMTSIQHVTLNN